MPHKAKLTKPVKKRHEARVKKINTIVRQGARDFKSMMKRRKRA